MRDYPEGADALVRPGDLLLEKSGGGEKSPVGFVVLYDKLEPAMCSNFVARLRLRPGMDSRFWTYLHGSLYNEQRTSRSVKQSTGIQNLDADSYFNEVVGFPPALEQIAIADYLDRETAEIDAFIADQEKLIELLTERRAATIEAGISSQQELLDAPRLHSVDSHQWKVVPLKRVVKAFQQGVSPQAEGGYADENSFGVLKAGCVNRGRFDPMQHKRLPPDFDFDATLLVRPGDLLVNRASGSPALVGSAARVTTLDYRLILSDKTFRLVPASHADPEFLALFLNSTQYRRQVQGAISGAEGLANNLPLSSLKEFVLQIPDLVLQKQIASSLNAEIASIDASMIDAREAIALSKERRAALISAAVTGKIDVREHRKAKG